MDDLERYDPAIHRGEVAGWYAAQKAAWDPESVSDEGVIRRGVAAGWFWRTNGPVAFIEGVITNPEATREQRHVALNSIHEWAKGRAKVCGARKLVALIEHDGLAKRAQEYGYADAGFAHVLVKEI
jgi:hypothetical protein